MRFLPYPLLLILCALGASKLTHAHPDERCAYLHFNDALILNKHRAPIYESLTYGQSRPISRKLIAANQLLRPLSKILDQLSQKHLTHQGRPFVCDVLPRVLGETPIQSNSNISNKYNASKVVPMLQFHLKKWKSTLNELRYTNHWDGLYTQSTQILNSYTYSDKNFYCMSRQYFLTLQRIAQLAPLYSDETQDFAWTLVHLSTMGLNQAIKLDQMALPIQLKGIPILCADISKIPEL